MLNDKKYDGSSVRVVLDRGRYDEMRRRSGRRSHVLRMIDRECFAILDMNRGELPEDATTSIFEIAESRKLLVQASTYIPGLPKLYVSYFNIAPEFALDMIMAVDEPKDRLDALRETMKAAMESGRGYTFLTLFLGAIGSLIFYQDIRDGILRLLADILVFIGDTTNGYEVSDNESVDLGGWLNEVLVSIKMEEGLSRSLSSLENVDDLGKGAHVIEPFLLIAEDVAERIKDPLLRVGALVVVVGALARAGQIDEALDVVERVKDPRGRVRALVRVAGALARLGETGRARRVAESAVSAADQIKNFRERTWALVGVVDMLARLGETGRARRVAESAEGYSGGGLEGI